ncbi:MAG TPA: hypothetical protein VII33_21270 [Nakamurella sp.]|jgi:hypothetical protein
MATFVQIIEFTTSHIDEIDALADEMRAKKEPQQFTVECSQPTATARTTT